MNSDIRILPIGDCLLKVIDNRGKTPPLSDLETPYGLIEVNALVGANKHPDSKAFKKYVNLETYNSWFRSGHPADGDILFSTVGSIAEVAIVQGGEGCIAQNLIALRPNPEVVNSDYLYYCLINPVTQAKLRTLDISSVQPSIKVPHLLATEISILSPSIQEEVVKILNALDSQISLLSEMNGTLESIAKAIFKSWFVDFDPVDAKVEGLVPEGMDEVTAALFPNGFETSDIGVLPSGWRIGKLSDLADLNPESWTDKRHPESVAYVDLANVKDNQIAAVTGYSFYDAPSRARRVLRSGDTIVGTVRPGNRSFAFIDQPQVNLTASTGFAVLRPLEKVNAEFVFLSATSESSIEHLAHIADGGAYPAVRPDEVIGLSCVLPCDEILLLFHQIARPLLSKVSENQKMIKTLSNCRDTLLPRLISGQLQIPEAEALA
ncbi:MAG: restriction endonuclease subunit S [Polynucleobacter sp.]